MSSRSKQRSKDRKEAAVVPPDERPPTFEELQQPLLGFSFYLLATGCLAMGLGQVMYFALLRHVDLPPFLIGWVLPLGQAMGMLGLVLGWRVVQGTDRRLMASGAILWLGLFALAFERAQVQHALMGKSVMLAVLSTEVAPWVGWAIVLGLLLVVLRGAGKRVGGPLWPAQLGLALVVAHSFELTWPTVVPNHHDLGIMFVLRNSQIGAIGLLLYAAGLFITGRRLLPEDAAEPAAKRKVNQRERPTIVVPTAGLLADLSVTLAGVTFALCASVAAAGLFGSSPTETALLAGTGGFALLAILLFVTLRRDPKTSGRPARLALGAVAASALYLATLFTAARSEGLLAHQVADGVFALPAILCAAALYATANAEAGKDSRVRVQHHARRRVTAAASASAMTLLVIGLLMGESDASFWLSTIASLAAFVGFARALVAAPPGVS